MVTFSFGRPWADRLALCRASALTANRHVAAAMAQPALATVRSDNFIRCGFLDVTLMR